MEQAEDFKAECAALYDLVAELSDAEFDQKTAFKGWTLNNVFRHLHVWNQAANLQSQLMLRTIQGSAM